MFLCSRWRWRNNWEVAVDWGGHSLMLWPRGLEGSPGHALISVALEIESVWPAKSCWVSLVKGPCIQDIQKSINLTVLKMGSLIFKTAGLWHYVLLSPGDKSSNLWQGG